MTHKYFISYAFKKRFGKWGFGSCFLEIYYELNEENHEHFCKCFAEMEKMKSVVLLNYKEIDQPTEKSNKVNEWLHSDIDDLIDMEYPTEKGGGSDA